MTIIADPPPKIAAERIVDNRVYTDPAVLEAEVERIFERVWLFACHDSEIPRSGDFVTMELLGTPVIVNRDSDGRVRAFCNTCRHRGSLVVEEARGHCSAFRCPYHFWVYSLEGDLVGIPGEEAYDGTGFGKEDFPLVPLPCESVFGLTFVHLGDDPEPLASWLGPDLVEVLRRPLGLGDYEVFAVDADPLAVNWKVFAENARDGYHVPFVHPFFRKASPPGPYHLFDNGHAVQHLAMDPAGIAPDLWEQLRTDPLPGLEVGEGYIANVFPDLAITVRSNVVSLDFQRVEGPTAVSMENRTLGVVGDSDQQRATRRLSQEVWFGNPVRLEDYPIFARQQRGVASRKVRHSIIARGPDSDTGTRGDDNRLRHFWIEWRQLMGTSSNSLEPIDGRVTS
jgi:phenylpropionate dioxygenase-like ring-hydroxylating dioxygenase large terminal subunit